LASALCEAQSRHGIQSDPFFFFLRSCFPGRFSLSLKGGDGDVA